MEGKKVIRKKMQECLMKQRESEREVKSDHIYKKVVVLDDWEKAACIGITISRTFEVNTRKLIKQAWREDKQVAVPRCMPATRELTFYSISSFDQLEVVYAGLYEPKMNETKLILSDAIDLLILPGMAFTIHGHRLGFGSGYYDRFLNTYDGHLMALAFDFQIQPCLPMESHDVPVNRIVTEKCVIELGHTNNNRK